MNLNMIKHMERYARTNPTIISLGQGIPSDPSDNRIKNAVADALIKADDIDTYSDPLGLRILREKISTHIGQQDMLYSPDEIMVTSGAIEAINATLHTIISNQQDEILLPTPTYSAYQRAIELAHGKVVPLVLNEKDSWGLSIEAVISAVTPRTAAILLCNPNNPTGSIYSKQQLRAICELAVAHGFVVLIDEVYGNILFDTSTLYSPATEERFKKHVARIVSFSKDFNLTGWRIGFLHSDKSLVDQIVPVHDTLVNCASVPAQYAAIAALDIAPEILAQNRTVYCERKHLMKTYLDTMDHVLSYSDPRGGYFYFVKVLADIDVTHLCHELATNAMVVAVPGIDFGPGGERYMRLCFGRSDADIREGMRRIKTYITSLNTLQCGRVEI